MEVKFAFFHKIRYTVLIRPQRHPGRSYMMRKHTAQKRCKKGAEMRGTMKKSNEESIMDIINKLREIDYINPEDIPNIDLYMDQVTTFMDAHLEACKRTEEDKILTKTMINNYTKNNLLPPPNKKKYSKEHMFLLIFLYYFKNVLSISDIQKIFAPLTHMFFDGGSKDISLEKIYEEIFKMEKEQTNNLTKDVVRRFKSSQEIFIDATDEAEADYLSRFAYICMLSFDVYMKKQIIERIIDETLDFDPRKNNK